jgi:hypothetical protein
MLYSVHPATARQLRGPPMITYLQTNQPQLVMTFEKLTTIYIKQYGPGNLRFGPVREDLLNSLGNAVQDGISQATADSFKQYFWEGDLWIISDAPGAVVVIAASYSFYIDRGAHGSAPNEGVSTDNENLGNLSTYR